MKWIRDWFEVNGKGCKAVIGISGGKDSSVVAALCVEALGKDRVFGVLMPQNTQSDIDVAIDLCKHLDINYSIIDIGAVVDNLLNLVSLRTNLSVSSQTKINCPPRIRMTTLYAVAQSMNGRVANTCNLSEGWVGYSTRYGDTAGDFSPLSLLTVQEVKAVGRCLGLPEKFIEKIPLAFQRDFCYFPVFSSENVFNKPVSKSFSASASVNASSAGVSGETAASASARETGASSSS